MYTIVGICSRCNGDVTIPEAWAGLLPPTPECLKCGARLEKSATLPILPMGETSQERHDRLMKKEQDLQKFFRTGSGGFGIVKS